MDVSGDLLPAANEAAIRALENGSLGLGFSGAGFLLFYVRFFRLIGGRARRKGERKGQEEGGLGASFAAAGDDDDDDDDAAAPEKPTRQN